MSRKDGRASYFANSLRSPKNCTSDVRLNGSACRNRHLTAAIRRLEKEVGATLIERGRKTVRLAPAGAVMLAEARWLLAGTGSALAATRDAAEIVDRSIEGDTAAFDLVLCRRADEPEPATARLHMALRR